MATALGNGRYNAPPVCAASLKAYAETIRRRPYNPVAGLLAVHFSAVQSEIDSGEPEPWKTQVFLEIWKAFKEGHERYLAHLPLEPRRNEILAGIPFDPSRLTLPALQDDLAAMAGLAAEIERQGLSQPEFAEHLRNLRDFIGLLRIDSNS